MILSTERGLDIALLAREKQCCRFFDFTLVPTVDGTVTLDIQVLAEAGPVRGTIPEERGVGTAEQVLDEFAARAESRGGKG